MNEECRNTGSTWLPFHRGWCWSCTREDRVGLVRGIEGTMLGSSMEQRKSGMNAERLSAIIHKRDVWDKKMHLALSFQMNAVLAKTQHKFSL